MTSSIKYQLIGIIVCMLCFTSITFFVTNGYCTVFDDVLREWIYTCRTPIMTKFFTVITYLGNWQTITGLSVLLLLIPRTRFSFGLPLAAVSLCSITCYKLLKAAFQRPRPDEALHLISVHDFSFPSGHSMNVLVFYGCLLYLLYVALKSRDNRINRMRPHFPDEEKNSTATTVIAILLGALIFLIGTSRIYLGVHYPTDVLGGWVLGLTIVLIFQVVWIKIHRSSSVNRSF